MERAEPHRWRVAGQRRGVLDAGLLHLDGGRGQVRLRPGRRDGLRVQGRPRLRDIKRNSRKTDYGCLIKLMINVLLYDAKLSRNPNMKPL